MRYWIKIMTLNYRCIASARGQTVGIMFTEWMTVLKATRNLWTSHLTSKVSRPLVNLQENSRNVSSHNKCNFLYSSHLRRNNNESWFPLLQPKTQLFLVIRVHWLTFRRWETPILEIYQRRKLCSSKSLTCQTWNAQRETQNTNATHVGTDTFHCLPSKDIILFTKFKAGELEIIQTYFFVYLELFREFTAMLICIIVQY